jgi:hypothetical protein
MQESISYRGGNKSTSFQQQVSIPLKKPNQYRGVSQVYNKSLGHQADFQERFKGRATLINKEGHAGVVQNAQKPIDKQNSLTSIAVLEGGRNSQPQLF